MKVPDLLSSVVPTVGEVWLWEPEKLHARAVLVVTALEWNGEEVWITSQTLERIGITWRVIDRAASKNEFSRWVQATIYVAESIGELNRLEL